MSWAFLGLLIFLVWGCVGKPGPAPRESLAPEVRQLLSDLARVNEDLHTFKASGRIVVRSRGELRFNQTALWAGEGDTRLRLTILGIGGRPQVSMVLNEDRLQLLFHAEGRLETFQVGDSGLRRLAGIDFPTRDLVALLFGRVPIPDFQEAEMDTTEPGSSVLRLKGRWGKLLQQIFFKPGSLQALRIEAYQASGKPRYQVELAAPAIQDNFQTPTRLEFSDEQNDRLIIEFRRYWPNAQLSGEIFDLTPPLPEHGNAG